MIDLRHGDCVEVLRGMADGSVDAIVCDPPYGLEFMGKEWDRLGAPDCDIGASNRDLRPTAQPGAVDLSDRLGVNYNSGRNVRCRRCRRWKWGHRPGDGGGGGLGCQCAIPDFPNVRGAEGAAMQAWHLRWAREAARVLKPGGHLLAFGGTRTYHRLACAVEDAGFEVRDSLAWMHSQGFPKSTDVGRAIDMDRCEQPGRHFMRALPPPARRELDDHVCPEHPTSESWRGHGTALKPSFEPIVVARKPLIGTVAANVQRFGTGAIHVDACRVATAEDLNGGAYSGVRRERDERTGSDAAPGAAPLSRLDRGLGAFEQPRGRWPSNLLLSHIGPDENGEGGCVRTGTRRVASNSAGRAGGNVEHAAFGGGMVNRGNEFGYADADGKETVETWTCAADGSCPVALLDAQSGELSSGASTGHLGGGLGASHGTTHGERARVPQYREADSGSASRFYPTFAPGPLDDVTPFFYCAKSSRSEREEGCEHLPARSGAEAVDRKEGSAGVESPRAGAGRTGGKKRLDRAVQVSYVDAAWVDAALVQRLPEDTARSLRRAIVGSTIRSNDGSAWSMCWCGSPATDPFHPAIRSIIATATSSTTESKILKSSPRPHTRGCMAVACGGTGDGGSLASCAGSPSPWARRTGIFPAEGIPCTDDADLATSVESWLTGGVETKNESEARVGVHNAHPT